MNITRAREISSSLPINEYDVLRLSRDGFSEEEIIAIAPSYSKTLIGEASHIGLAVMKLQDDIRRALPRWIWYLLCLYARLIGRISSRHG